MQCLAPFEPREAGPSGASATRFPWVFTLAIAACVALAAFLLMDWREVIDLLRRHTVLQAELAVCGGTLAGLLLSRMEAGPVMRKRLAVLDALYEQAAAYPVRVESGYTHYLPCVLLMADEPSANLSAALHMRSESAVLKAAASGLFYVGPKGALLCTIAGDEHTAGMDPHLGRAAERSWRWQSMLSALRPRKSRPARQISRLDLGQIRQVTAVSIAMPQGHFARLARIRPRYAMLLRWPTGQALLAIPAIGDTLPKLHRCLDDLRWAS
jgi:hypothetical protein